MSTVSVKVLLFAAYAELLGRAEFALELDGPVTVAGVVARVRALSGDADRLPSRPLVAVNRVHARLDTPVQSGDEVALLPPLAGG